MSAYSIFLKSQNMILSLLFVFACTLASPAYAHDVTKGLNGGQIEHTANHHVEFVARGTSLIFYLTDAADKSYATQGATGRVTVLDGGKTSMVTLSPIAPNQMVGSTPTPLAKGAKLVASFTFASGETAQVRFEQK